MDVNIYLVIHTHKNLPQDSKQFQVVTDSFTRAIEISLENELSPTIQHFINSDTISVNDSYSYLPNINGGEILVFKTETDVSEDDFNDFPKFPNLERNGSYYIDERVVKQVYG